MKVQEVMSRSVECCRIDDDLNRPAQLMWENDFGVVPVVDEGGFLVGVLTDRDLCMAAYTQGRVLGAIKVGEVMSRQVESCSPGSSAEVALALMKEIRVRRLPVVDTEGCPVGMLSLNDLAREAARSGRIGDRHLSLEVAEALAVIGELRGAFGERAGDRTEATPAKGSARKRGPVAV
jgi:CBS domain-containing protein